MDIRILRPDPTSPSGGDGKVIDRFAKGTIYSRRWVIDLLLFIAIVSLSILLVGQRSTYNHVVDLGVQNNQLLKEVKSCTDPAGACAQRGQKATSTAVDRINQISIIATYCANRQPPPVSVQVVRDCVQQELNK